MSIRERHRKFREELKSRLFVRRSWTAQAADFLSQQLGAVWFFFVNALFFVFWIVANLGLIPAVEPFDPYPFNFLTMVVSLEAIFLSIIVLISQNRQSHIADTREQIDFEVNVRGEEEATKILIIAEKIAKHLNISLAGDPELKALEEHTDLKRIRERIEQDQ